MVTIKISVQCDRCPASFDHPNILSDGSLDTDGMEWLPYEWWVLDGKEILCAECGSKAIPNGAVVIA